MPGVWVVGVYRLSNNVTRVKNFSSRLQHALKEERHFALMDGVALNERVQIVQKYMLNLPSSRVQIIGSKFDDDCREIRAFLSMNRIPYEWVDRERSANRAPTDQACEDAGLSVVVDGSFCVSHPPTVRKVAEALGFQTAPHRQSYDVVIVGGGPAGLAAAVYGASEGLSVLLVERKAPA
jgi:thioredoxin reductase (NADPH)